MYRARGPFPPDVSLACSDLAWALGGPQRMRQYGPPRQ